MTACVRTRIGLAILASAVPLCVLADHGTHHQHDFLKDLTHIDETSSLVVPSPGRKATKPAKKSGSAARRASNPRDSTLAVLERDVATNAYNTVRELLDVRHGEPTFDVDHALAHGDLSGVTMEQLEAAADPNAGLWTTHNGKSFVVAQTAGGGLAGPPDQIGQWSGVIGTPVLPVFAALLPNGKVLIWDSVGDNPTESYTDHTYTRAGIFDPANSSTTRVDVSGYNIFCAGFAHLDDGRVFVAGGNKDSALNGIRQTHIFDHNNNSWSRGPDMAFERWYPSVAALSNGEHFVMGGGPNTHEVRQTNNTIRTLSNAVLDHPREYPFIQTAPDGRVMYVGPQQPLRLLNANGTGQWQQFADRDSLNRNYGSYALYDIGKAIVAGGASSNKTTTLVAASGGTLSATAGNDMVYGRRQHNATVLADGTVLVTGGLSSGAGLVDLNAGVYAAELWNPSTGAWRELASAAVTRQYHSVALLLPDGRVLTGGGGICGDCFNVGYLRKDFEIFSPPYLFRKDGSGQLATRPTINSVPARINYAQGFAINTSNSAAIRKVGLVRLGAPTHGQDQDQRYVPIGYTAGPNVLNATAPANANIAPPGYYMLFVVDDQGVPSVASMIQVSEPSGGTGTGLRAEYFNNTTLSGSPALTRTESVDYDWGDGSPGGSIGTENFSARWSGQVEAPVAGTYQFRTISDDGVRLYLNDSLIIDNWTDHAPTADTSGTITLAAGSKSNIRLEYYERGGGAVIRLQWKPPGASDFVAIPASRLFPAAPPSNGTFASTIIAAHSNQCLDVPGSTTATGRQLQQYTCNGTNAQLFDLTPVAGTSDTYTIKNRGNGLCVDINGASQSNGARVIQWTCHTGANQQFQLVAQPGVGPKAFQVKPKHSGKCMDVSGASQAVGAKVQQWGCGNANNRNQIWILNGKP